MIPFVIEQAIRTSMYGTPGPVYVDLPVSLTMMTGRSIDSESVSKPGLLPSSY